jgi:dGTPase
LNLTHEVRNGIVKHSKGKGLIIPDRKSDRAETLEGQVVRVSDLIAYVNHDLDDALRAEVIKRSDIPRAALNVLGNTHAKRIDAMVKDFIYSSRETGLQELRMSDKMSETAYKLRDFLYERVYESPVILNEFKKAKKILKDLYEYYLEHIEEVFTDIPAEKKINNHRMVCDFIAGMTDSFALMTYERIFLPQQWTVL